MNFESSTKSQETDVYRETSQGAKILATASLFGGHNIALGNKTVIGPCAVVRGDLAKVKIGKYCLLGENTVLRPPFKNLSGGLSFFSSQVGSHTMIGKNCVLEALKIGSFVHIGDNCIIGKRCIISDCCKLEDGTVLPADTVTAPFTAYKGIPARMSAELCESFEYEMTQLTRWHHDGMEMKP